MITKQQIENFLGQIRSQANSMDNRVAGLSVQQQLDRTGVSITAEQMVLLKQEKDKLQAIQADLAGMKKDFAPGNVTSKDFIKKANEINNAIATLEARLKVLSNPNNSDNLTTAEQQAEACFCVQMIQINIQRLAVLAEIAKIKSTAGVASRQSVDPVQLDEMRTALFTGTNPDSLLVRTTAFVTKIVPAVVDRILTANASAYVKIPKTLQELLDFNSRVRTQYNEADGGTHVKDNDIGSLALWAHKKRGRRARTGQIQLLERCLKDLKGPPQEYNRGDQLKIIKGLMLIIKHQVDKEWLVFKSRLGGVVTDILEVKGDLSGIPISDAVKAFQEYAQSPQKQEKLGINPEMLEKINGTAKDQKWIAKEEKRSSPKTRGKK